MAARQKRLMLLFGLLLAMQAAFYLFAYAKGVQGGDRFGGDFISFWRAAQSAHDGNLPAIYDPDGWRRILLEPRGRELSWFVYPPFTLFLLWPLGGLSYNAAVFWWSVIPLPLYIYLLGKLLGRSFRAAGSSESVPLAVYLLALALTLPLLLANLFSGQSGTWIAVFLMAAASLLPTRPVLAGIFIGLVAIKPQLGILLPFALAASGQWRTFLAAAITVVLLAFASTMWLGTQVWADYFAMSQVFAGFIGQGHQGLRQLAVGPFVSLQALGLPIAAAATVQVVTSLAAAGTVVWAFRDVRNGWDKDGRMDLRLGVLAVATMLVTPYTLSYDTPLLALAIVPLLARAWHKGWDGIGLASIVALALLPFVSPAMIDRSVPFGFLALLLTLGALIGRYRPRSVQPVLNDIANEKGGDCCPRLLSVP